jgi:hypothetical protein
MKSFIIAVIMLLTLSVPSLACEFKYDVSADLTVCGDPRLITHAVNDGTNGSAFNLQFVNANGKFKSIWFSVASQGEKTLTRWVKGGTVARIFGAEGELLDRTIILRHHNIGPCP